VPPHGLLVVTWRHGDLTLDSGFRLTDAAVGGRGVTGAHDDWIDAISKMTKENAT
jgi:hypothetical protein